MFPKGEAKKIRQEFWISFGKEYPRKWVLYRTKIKDVSLKFTFTEKIAQVAISIENSDPLIRAYYFDKLLSLQSILQTAYLPSAIFEENCQLENGKYISQVYVEKLHVNIYNKNTWENTMYFLSKHMTLLEAFFMTYKEHIQD